jgi:thiaminase/transcriptional activator TenA
VFDGEVSRAWCAFVEGLAKRLCAAARPHPAGRPGPRHLPRRTVAARAYAARFGISEQDLETAAKSPVYAAYTDFLLRTAATGDLAEIVAALLPCMWGYSEIGRALQAAGPPAEPRYRQWVETYADPGFAELAAWCVGLLDRVAACERAFRTNLDHELAFWDA